MQVMIENSLDVKLWTQVIQPLRVTLLQLPQSSACRTTSRLMVEVVQSHRLLQTELHVNLALFHYIKIGQQLAPSELDHYLTFSGFPKDSNTPKHHETV